MLSFAEYIAGLPHELVFDRFVKDSSSPRRVLSSSKLHEIQRRASEPERVRARFDALDEGERFRCALAFLCGARGIPAEDVSGFDSSLPGSFLVYASKTSKGATVLTGFREFVEPLKERLVEAILARTTVEENPASGTYLNPRFWLNDLAVVLSAAAQHNLCRTRNGRLTKTTTDMLGKLLHVFGRHYLFDGVAATELLLAFAENEGLIAEYDGDYRVDHSKVLRRLSGSPETCGRDLIDFALDSSGSWSGELLEALVEALGDRWVDAAAFPSWFRAREEDLLSTLQLAGRIRVGHRDDRLIWSRSPEDAEGPGAMEAKSGPVIMPDFCAIFPMETAPVEIFRFARVGAPTVLDGVYRGEVRRRLIQESLREGFSEEAILQCLHDWRAPANVVESVREWMREFGRLYVTSETILVSSDEIVTGQVLAHPELSKLMEPIPAHQVFRIKRGREQQARDLLTALGFDPRKPQRNRPLKKTSVSRRTAAFEEGKPVFDFGRPVREENYRFRGGKYGAGMKALDTSEMIHLVDYAILMGRSLVLGYAGSPAVKRGRYVIRPRECTRGMEPAVDGEVIPDGGRKRFLLKKTEELGVAEQ